MGFNSTFKGLNFHFCVHIRNNNKVLSMYIALYTLYEKAVIGMIAHNP
jgi:hypothetical protein